jgi:hypothetical protein
MLKHGYVPIKTNPDKPIEEHARTTFSIPEVNMGLLHQRVDKLNRIAIKIGAEPIILTVGEEQLVGHGDSYYKVFNVSITGESPIIAGWQFVATIQHGDEGNVLRKAPDFTEELPYRFRTLGQQCEHCGYQRARKDTYIIRNVDNGDYKQVGRTCLRDFLGHADPYALADWAERLSDLGREFGDLEDRETFGGGGVSYYSLINFMDVAAAIIRVEGWVSRAMAHMEHEYDKKPVSTSERIYTYYFDNSSYANEWRRTINISEQDKLLSATALIWAKSIPEDVDNDYLWNIRVISNSKAIEARSFGLAASIIAAYQRKLQRDTETASIVNEHVGEVGGRGLFNLTVTNTREIGGTYGPVTIVSFKDEAGRVFKWFASGVSELEVGKTYTIRATIKAHSEYKGIKETQITRGKVVSNPASPLRLLETIGTRHETNPTYYHTTNRYFEGLDLGKVGLGLHVGTRKQAYSRRTTGFVMVVDCEFKKPLRMPDLRMWHWNRVLGALVDNKIFSREESFNIAHIPLDDRNYEELAVVRYAAIRQLLLSKGYDSIVYKNLFEGVKVTGRDSDDARDSYIIITPDVIKNWETIEI